MNSLLPQEFATAVIVQVAMDEEATPFLELTEPAADDFGVGAAQFYPRTLNTAGTTQPVLLVRSKIGLVNAATALTTALGLVSHPAAVLSAGTAGGLHTSINVGDIVVGADYTYTDADATAFGYEYGQVPGMPARYQASKSLLEQAQAAAQVYTGEGQVRYGTMLAGGSFVTAHNVKNTREIFPEALSTDMETTALAQICVSRDLPFISVRGVSDLCGPAADQDFHMDAPIVAARSAQLVTALINTPA